MKAWLLALAMALSSMSSQAQMRLVSIDGSVTEIIYALGAEQQLVAVDTTSRYPPAATELPDVGYMRQLSVEGILSLTPTTVIASDDAGPEEVFTQLQAAGVKVVKVKDDASLAGVSAKIAAVARALGREAAGEVLQQQVEQQVQQAQQRLAPLAGQRALLLLGAGNRGLMAAGTGTQAQALLDMLSLENVIQHPGYKPLNPESALAVAPQVVIVAQTGPLQVDNIRQQLALTPAIKNDRLVVLDAGLLLGFGPRLAQALTQLQQALLDGQSLAEQ